MLTALLVVSPSPFIGVIFLVFSRVLLASRAGATLRRWAFFSIIIVYVGGVLVLFVYISRLIREHKVLEVRTSWGQVAVVLLLFLVLSQLCLGSALRSLSFNLRQGLIPSRQGITLYSVVYLIIALVVVLRLLGKDGGPMKSSN